MTTTHTTSAQAKDLPAKGGNHDRLLFVSRALLLLLLASFLVLWLINLPEYFIRLTTLTVQTYAQAGEVVISNGLVQTEAAARGLPLPFYALYQIALSGFLIFSFWFVAVLILWRAENRWFGWFTALVLVALGAVNTLDVFYVTQPWRSVLATVDLLSWIVWPGLFLWFFLFPKGWTTPRWAWWSIIAMMTIFLGLSARGFLAAWDVLPPDPANLQFVVGLPLGLVTLVLVVYVQVQRYRGAYSTTEKQQVKWFVFGLALLVVEVAIFAVVPPEHASPYLQDLFGAALLVIPLSIAIAILRYRLWDINVIIRKTLVYATLTALLALVYFGTIVLLQQVFGAVSGVEQSPLAIVVSTLVIAALFTPLRRRVQNWIDRRFFRKKYNAQQVLDAFALHARDETDLDALTAELVRVVQETMQPEHISVWLKDTGSRGRTQ